MQRNLSTCLKKIKLKEQYVGSGVDMGKGMHKSVSSGQLKGVENPHEEIKKVRDV